MHKDSHRAQPKSYTKPELVRYGTLQSLTAGATGTGAETAFYAKSG